MRSLNHLQLQAFAAVAECGSFDRAAQQLHVTQSAVSQRIKQLEEQLGQLLIVRGQPLALTVAGETLRTYQRRQQLLEAELLGQLGCDEANPGGAISLSIALNADSLATWFLDALQPVLQAENWLFDLRVCDQEQTQEFLRRGEVLGCISADPAPLQGCRVVGLGRMDYRALANPDFCRRHFVEGVTAAALRRAPAVDYDLQDQLLCRFVAHEFGLGRGDYPRHRVPSPQAYLQMVAAGFSWGMLPDLQSRDLLAKGELQELLPGTRVQVPLYWHVSALASTSLQRLQQALQAHAAKVLEPL